MAKKVVSGTPKKVTRTRKAAVNAASEEQVVPGTESKEGVKVKKTRTRAATAPVKTAADLKEEKVVKAVTGEKEEGNAGEVKEVKKEKAVAKAPAKEKADGFAAIREMREYKSYFRKGIVMYDTEAKTFRYYMLGKPIKDLNNGIRTMHVTRLTKKLRKGEVILNDNLK
jgi:hypothetical protein